jgi:hypothetical protein
MLNQRKATGSEFAFIDQVSANVWKKEQTKVAPRKAA